VSEIPYRETARRLQGKKSRIARDPAGWAVIRCRWGMSVRCTQLVFIAVDGGLGMVDRKAEAIELMKLARKRV
jgi:hypothetical protein